MVISPERMERLRSFGLSEYASRAYLALLELGTTEARDVSRLSKIPVAKVYSTLDQLQEKGLVLVSPESPKKYAPVPFTEFMDRLRKAHEEMVHEIEAQRDEVAALFPIVGLTEMDDRGGVVTLRGRRHVHDRMRDLASVALRDVYVIASEGGVQRQPHLRRLVEEASGRGVRCRVLAPFTGATMPTIEAMGAFCELRARAPETGQAPHVSLALFDGRAALLVHHIPDDTSGHAGKDVAILVDEVALVQALRSFAEQSWEVASSVPARSAAGATPDAAGAP